MEGNVKDKKTRQKYLKRTSKGVDRLIYIIRDLDLITQFESGVKTIERHTFNVLELINNVFELMEIQATKNKISLELDNDYPQPIWVHADEERIMKVL
ncbi:MAG: sensor histidine kinase, partial [Flavobacteriaceae bacterium]